MTWLFVDFELIWKISTPIDPTRRRYLYVFRQNDSFEFYHCFQNGELYSRVTDESILALYGKEVDLTMSEAQDLFREEYLNECIELLADPQAQNSNL